MFKKIHHKLMSSYRGSIVFSLVCVSLLACSSSSTSLKTKDNFIAGLQQGRGSLDLSQPYVKRGIDKQYLQRYNIIPENLVSEVQYFTGLIRFDGQSISAHVFSPKNAIATVFILHGYFDHVGSLNQAINIALNKNYTVITYDLPGHGLSSGVRGDIGGIAENAVLLNKIVDKYQHFLPKPYYLLGFSTGGSIALEYMRGSEAYHFEKFVLVSPLVRHTNWYLGKAAYTIFGSFIKNARRRDRKNSTNIEYLNFAKQDALRNSHLSISFPADVYRWNKDYLHSSVIDASALVVQGSDDKVVDWAYNIPLLEKKIRGLEIYMLPRGKHQLFNEIKTIREDVFEKVFQFLGG